MKTTTQDFFCDESLDDGTAETMEPGGDFQNFQSPIRRQRRRRRPTWEKVPVNLKTGERSPFWFGERILPPCAQPVFLLSRSFWSARPAIPKTRPFLPPIRPSDRPSHRTNEQRTTALGITNFAVARIHNPSERTVFEERHET